VAEPQAFEIVAGEAADTLKEFARQANLQTLFDYRLVRNLRTRPVQGAFEAEDALQKMLAGTGLKFERINERTVAIKAGPQAGAGNEQKIGTQADFRLVQDSADTPAQGSVAHAQGNEPLEEIVVTAQKRVERLQDVPVPVTAIRAQDLVTSNQLRLQDYYTRIPGLNLSQGNRGETFLSVRGITAGGYANPTVGITVDDIPYGGSNTWSGGNYAPDVDPNDLERVELLRGPQGTLYGASSIGGLLKFVTIDPSTNGFTGRVQAGLSSVKNGDEVGYNVRGAVNVPLGDSFAVRASGFTRRDPGYIDNVTTGVDGVNKRDTDGGQLSALWRPSEAFSIKLGALVQKSDSDGSPLIQPALGDLRQAKLPETGFFNRKTQVYTANISAKLGRFELAAISGYGIYQFHDALDLGVTLPTGEALAIQDHVKTDKLTQEVRLSGPLSERLDWLVGAFYTDEKSHTGQHVLFADPATGDELAAAFQVDVPTKFQEFAAFTDLTFHLTDRLDIQVGARESKDKQHYAAAIFGVPGPAIDSDERAFTYLLTPQLKLSADLMIYARFASGYRAGGPNTILFATDVGVVPESFDPDKTQNYEIGLKGNLLDRALSFDASLYYIDWKDVQISLIAPSATAFTANGGKAKSQGVELSVQSRPVGGLTVAGWVSFSDAQLTEDFPATTRDFGDEGDRLPYSARFSGNLSLDEAFPLTAGASGFVGASLSYVGNRESYFSASPQRQRLPSYTQTDLRAGVRLDTWEVNLFANNITDRRGVLTGGTGPAVIDPSGFTYIQPRTVGITATKSF
jgi:outer membrane receptor protein involved in Fe transport